MRIGLHLPSGGEISLVATVAAANLICGTLPATRISKRSTDLLKGCAERIWRSTGEVERRNDRRRCLSVVGEGEITSMSKRRRGCSGGCAGECEKEGERREKKRAERRKEGKKKLTLIYF
ncbi:hypothetical protein L484_005587 [Morus notabilis]|uniref:Uncharacterized protein n=1 Tax=Morus notabilis TaxID=981085 RepID=W9RQD4_9ROSA|nr:hypothetical protein L484_005587 [Morus notabilis]